MLYSYVGESVTTTKQGRVHSIPFQVDDPAGPVRTCSFQSKCAADAHEVNSPVSSVCHVCNIILSVLCGT